MSYWSWRPREIRPGRPKPSQRCSTGRSEVAAYLRPGLTTVALPHEEMGRRAVELLLSGRVQGETLIPMPVIERASIGAPR